MADNAAQQRTNMYDWLKGLIVGEPHPLMNFQILVKRRGDGWLINGYFADDLDAATEELYKQWERLLWED